MQGEDDLLVKELEAMERSEFLEQQYIHANNGVIPELPEDYYIIKDGYRSREL